MRIFIDCSLIDFKKIPTGIPRVVVNYLNHGISLGKRNCYEVIPVVFYGKEMIFPFQLPKHLQDSLLSNSERRLRWIATKTHEAIERMRKILFHIFTGCGHVLLIDNRKLDQIVERILKIYLKAFQLLPYLIERRFKRFIPTEGDILFCPAYWHDVDSEIYQNIKERGCKVAFLVHDILPILYPQYYHYPWRHYFRKKVLAAFQIASELFTVSSFTKDCINQLAADNNLPLPSINVIWNGIDEFDENIYYPDGPFSKRLKEFADKFPIFLLMVGSIEPKKGHIPIIEQLCTLWAEGFSWPLLVVGKLGWMWEGVVEVLNDKRLSNRLVFWFDDLDDNDLVFVYKRARFLLFGSEAEGFGLPMIEALHFGCPVIANDTPIAREILGKFGLFYRSDKSELCKLLKEYSNDVAYKRLKLSISNFSWPCWRQCAESLFEYLASMNGCRNLHRPIKSVF